MNLPDSDKLSANRFAHESASSINTACLVDAAPHGADLIAFNAASALEELAEPSNLRGEGAIATGGRVERCLALLDAAARGENVTASVFEAVVTIQRGRQDRATAGPIDLEQRGRLLTASVQAQAGARKHLPDYYDRASLNAGMWAIAYQITMWAESLDKTSRRNPDDVLDFHEGARIFQNDMENITLRERYAERARKRLKPDLSSQSPSHSF